MRIEKIKVPDNISLNGLAVKGTDGWYDTSKIVVEYEDVPESSPIGVVTLEADDKNTDNQTPAKCMSGVEIDGFLFIPEEIKGDETYRKRNFQRTDIMSGGQFVSRTRYQPREYSFTCYFDIDPSEPYYYDKVFTKMQNRKCKVISPYISSNPFYSAVVIQKTNPIGSPQILKVDVKLTEIPDAVLEIEGDTHIEYPSTTTISPDAIKVSEVQQNTGNNDTTGSGGRHQMNPTSNFVSNTA